MDFITGTHEAGGEGWGGKGCYHEPKLLCLGTSFTLRVTEPWPRLPREAGESPSLQIFQLHLAAVLCSLLWVTLLGQGVGLGDPQRALPTPTMLGFCDSVPILVPSPLREPHPHTASFAITGDREG